MATTSTWSIKNNLKVSLDYIMNPEKTINSDYGNDYYIGLELTSNKDYNFKKELSHYVSGVNCIAEIESLQPQIKDLYNNRNYCDGIYKRSIKFKII